MADKKAISKQIQSFGDLYLTMQNIGNQSDAEQFKMDEVRSFLDKNENLAVKALDELNLPSGEKGIPQFQSKLLIIFQEIDNTIGICKALKMSVNEIVEGYLTVLKNLFLLPLFEQEISNLREILRDHIKDPEAKKLFKIIDSYQVPPEKESGKLFAALKAVDQKFGEGDAKLAA